MDISVGLPSVISGVDGQSLLEWARRAEQRGFASLVTLDRVVYGNYEPLVALAAVAAVTQRVRVVTSVLLAPLRTNTALLAKQAATIDCLSGGRLVLGLGVGMRDEDYQVSGADFTRRGRTLDAQIEELKRIWSGAKRGFAGRIGPAPVRPSGPELLVGGISEAAIQRAAHHADGWIAGAAGPGVGAGPDAFKRHAEAVRQAWAAAHRTGRPRLLSQNFFALGENAQHQARTYLRDYYGFAGGYADTVADHAVVSAEMIRDYLLAYAAAGCDELIFLPTSADPTQLEQLADIAL